LKTQTFLAAQLINTDLSFSNLINADLSRTNLQNTNLHGANLTSTKFVRVDTHTADFSEVFFNKTKLTSCFGNDSLYRTLVKILDGIEKIDFVLLKPIEWLIPKLCGPHYYIDLNTTSIQYE